MRKVTRLSAWELACHVPADKRFAGQPTSPVVRKYPLSADADLLTGHATGTPPCRSALAHHRSPVSRLAPRREAGDTAVMAEWIGLAGVLAGALIALGGQYLLRSTERKDRISTLVLEQSALLIAMSEDFRGRIWAERNEAATGLVEAWDAGAYRLAEARLRLLSPGSAVAAELESLRETGKDLGKAWSLAPGDTAVVDSAWKAYRVAIDRFVAVSSRALAPGR
jgi:hypothetical protein